MLLPLLIALFFVAVTEQSHPAAGKASGGGGKGGILAALMSPLDLFAERSPGGRGAGALLSTKPERTAALDVPEERVLSGIRERDPPVDGIPPGLGEPVFGIGPEGGPGGGPAASVASNTLPSDDPFGGGPFGGGPGFASGPGQPLLGQAPTFPTGPSVVSAVPEPATWAMLILGFFAIGAALRRRKQAGPPCVPCRAP